MIRIQATTGSVSFSPEELRTIGTVGIPYVCRHGKILNVTDEQYRQETCPEIDTEAWRRRAPSSDYRGINYHIVFTLKSGERHLIAAGPDLFTVSDTEDKLLSMIDDAVINGEKLTVIDMDDLVRQSGDPPYYTTRLVSGDAAGALLRFTAGRLMKIIRTTNRQISIDPCGADVSKAAAYFLFDEDIHETGTISREAYEILYRKRICSAFLPDEDEDDAFPLQLGKEYFIRIRTRSETYLILTGERSDDNERWFRMINDGMSGMEALIDLTPKDEDTFAPQLMSREATQKTMRFLYEVGGESPILP